jgi:AGCS family alanine or glycine:cation symporter
VVLAIAVMLFAFSTMIAWSYYGLKAWTYLFGNSRRTESSYKLLFLVFIVIGASMQLDAIIGFSDAMILAMAFPNLLGMLFLLPEVRADLAHYLARIRLSGAAARPAR